MSCCAKPIRKSRQKKYKEIYDKYKRFLIENENANKIPTNLSSASYTIYDNYVNDTSSETIREPYQAYHDMGEFTKKDIRILKKCI